MAGVVEPDVGTDLSLLGGPFHRLGIRLGLVWGRTNTFRFGLAIGVTLWGVLTALVFSGGLPERYFSLASIGVHIRLLLVIPLFFMAETWLEPRLGAFTGMIARSGMASESVRLRIESAVARVCRRKDSWLPDTLCLVVAVILSVFAPKLQLPGLTTALGEGSAAAPAPLAAQWYIAVCLPIFRFLLLRWIWRIGAWTLFLWRLSRLELRLVPIHPDGAGGLGYLEVVHDQFFPLILAHSALQASLFAEEITSGAMAFEAMYPSIAIILAIDAVVFLGPLFLFTPKLWACRINGLRDYMTLAESYVQGFAGKWLGASPPAEPLLGTADIQSLADLNNSVAIVRGMKLAPLSMRIVRDFAIAALAPMLPLLLLKYPIVELAQRLATRVLGR